MKQFIHLDNQPYWDLNTVTSDEGRLYETPEGSKYPSVTTVTGWDKRLFFKKWRKENPQESKRVLGRGNIFHEIVENYLNNKDPFEKENPSDYWNTYIESAKELFHILKDELNKIDNIRVQETALWSKLLTLAGRVDCIAEYNGKLSIIDFKTSTKPKSEKDIENYFLQATAYAIMWHERTKQPINQIVILVATDEGFSQVFTADPVDYVPKLRDCINKYYQEQKQLA